jgi:chorismate synthase
VSAVRMTTAGESHGPQEICILEGIPAGLRVSAESIDVELARRQKGYGRGGRMAIEKDHCEFAAGVRLGETLGSPIAILVANKDHANWHEAMRPESVASGAETRVEESTVPRPGHADFAGMAKFRHASIRPVLERASARETVARVAGGAVCKRMLEELGVTIHARVVGIGAACQQLHATDYCRPGSVDWEAVEASPVGCEDAKVSQDMCVAIDTARDAGESLGGVFEVWAWGVCPGLGSHVTMDGRLDGRLLGAVGSIPAIKGVEIGLGFEGAVLAGSQAHDAFVVRDESGWRGVGRPTNRAGGLEGGMTNGMPLIVRAAMKPIPTLTNPLVSVDLATMRSAAAHVERSDVTAVPAARVVGEAIVAHVLAGAYAEKFGGDCLVELLRNFEGYCSDLRERGLWHRS